MDRVFSYRPAEAWPDSTRAGRDPERLACSAQPNQAR